MWKRLADNRETSSVATRMRRKRFAFFQDLLAPIEKPIHILDVGGTEEFWLAMGVKNMPGLSVTLLNLAPQELYTPGMTSLVGDARNLNFPDQHFEVVFSNSVIEHVGDYRAQKMMANEVQRVAKRYFIQTPNKYFPIEPHFLFPFFQFLPLALRAWLLQHFRLGWIGKTPDYSSARDIVESIRLLSKRELQHLFPRGSIYEEKFLGLTKSFVAYGGWQ